MVLARPSPARPPARRPRPAWLLDVGLAFALLGFLALVSATAPRWSRYLRQPLQSAAEDSGTDEPDTSAPTPSAAASAVERTINVKLFFGAPDDSGLALEERTVPFSSDLARQIESVVGELVGGSRQGLAATLPADTRVLGAFVTGGGVAYVNLSKEVQTGAAGGSHAELISVYSLVDSIAANFPAVSRVQILVDDRPAETLAGHVDISRPLPADMSLLAAALLTPVAPAPDSTAASPAPVATGGQP